ncbi:hypothetical protein H4219_003958 [Mycoemilia scoparia]|uniref:P-type ATPase A domain-containing protein n=1 Tax=Mycoemilia scoparia TaxID=417184 RepID=A0A9W8A1A2_9FUNG|nr:hypothetical protein H4219_003958 [Mycoemilia scoparia]
MIIPKTIASGLGLAAALIAIGLPPASANNNWSTVNQVDEKGNACPLDDKPDVVCPAVCVTQLSDCPQSLVPSCPNNQEFCADGQCHDQCTDDLQAKNPCHCERSGKKLPDQAIALIPCMSIGNVTIHQYKSWDKKAQTFETCAGEANIANTGDIGVWGTDWDSSVIWAQCPKAPQKMYSFDEKMWIAVFSIIGIVAFLSFAWTLLKLFLERKVRAYYRGQKRPASGSNSGNGNGDAGASKFKDGDIDSENSHLTLDLAKKGEKGSGSSTPPPQDNIFDTDDVQLRGYRNNFFGTFLCIVFYLFSAFWICYMAVLCADYYGSLPAPNDYEFALSHGDSTLGKQTFIVIWVLVVIWFVCLNVYKNRLRNFMRIQTLPADGHYVRVERKVEAEIMLEEKSFLLDAVRRCEKFMRWFTGWTVQLTTCPLKKTGQGRLYFTYQCTRYVYNESTNQFDPYSFNLGSKNAEILSQADGLSTEEALLRAELVGPNFIEVNVPSIPMAFALEFMSFFYLYQALILWLFYYYAYYQVGLVNTGVILLSAFIKVVIRIISERRVKRMAEHDDQIEVLRDGEWVKKSTRALVPGDVIVIEKGMHMSCDATILSGNIVVDESSLTGEALPIRKFPIRMDQGNYDREGSGKMNTLFSGTTISQVSATPQVTGDLLANDRVIAIVQLTGTSTDKGKLIQKILFPAPVSFIFNEQLKVVIIILMCYAIIIMGLAIFFYASDSVATWFYGMFCVSQLLSPLLPAALVMGQSLATWRLRHKKIFCVDPPRIIIAGKVQIFCFDKTGTLTKEGLEFFGGQPIVPDDSSKDVSATKFEHHKENYNELNPLMRMAIGGCHAVTDLNGQLIGNPVDIEQFRATGWTISDDAGEYVDTLIPSEDSPDSSPIHVIKRFEFVHARMSMSVAILDPTTGHVHIFVKGSFEKVRELADPNSAPADYDQATSKLAREGCYVLALAHRDLGAIDPLTIREWSRDELEKDCSMLGLLVFKNKLKPDTTEAIGELKSGNTRTVMITGDTALTGVYIARQCGMVPEGNRVLLADVNKKTNEIEWTDVDSQEIVEDFSSQMSGVGEDGWPNVELAMTGKAFNQFDEMGVLPDILLNTRVFARMTPNDKVRCVQLHMARGITAMCGDGGNDCGALRASHAGLALSDAEASIVSPFSSSNRSVMSCVELIRQARAGLATSFAGYKFMILYGQTMAMLKVNTFYFAISVSQPLWIFIDAIITVTIAGAIAFSPPAKKLAAYRPTARILGPQTLSSTIGLVLINWIYVIGGWFWLFSQHWYRCNQFDSSGVDLTKWYLLGDNFEAQTLAFICLFQFVHNGFVCNFGHYYRRPFFRNYVLIVIWAAFVAIISIALLANPNRLGCWMRLNCGDPDVLKDLGYSVPVTVEKYNNEIHHNVMPTEARWKLWGICISNMVAVVVWELIVVLYPVRNWLRQKRPLRRLKLKL